MTLSVDFMEIYSINSRKFLVGNRRAHVHMDNFLSMEKVKSYMSRRNEKEEEVDRKKTIKLT